LAINRFPTFCGLLVGGSIILQPPIRHLFLLLAPIANRHGWRTSRLARERLVRIFASFISAWLSFQLLNRGKTERIRRIEVASMSKDASKTLAADKGLQAQDASQTGQPSFVLVGKTMDLTLFGVTRALDICVGEAWSRHRVRRIAARKWTKIESTMSKLADASVFSASVCIIMWAWFYMPERLPRTYNKWIGEAAQVDNRLIEALRRARRGEWIYGKDTGQADLLGSMCEDYGWPIEWGDPATTIPIPCEMVHMGTGPTCEKHCLSRFYKAFRFALATYLPLQLVMRLRAPSMGSALQGLKEAARSSAFLGSFISLFYYSVCLARTRLGPRVFSRDRVTPMMWDSGLCIAAGCMMCGWSILIEKARRRQEIAFFVAPRAAATLLPRRYEEKVTRSTPFYSYVSKLTLPVSNTRESSICIERGYHLHLRSGKARKGPRRPRKGLEPRFRMSYRSPV
jgi:hypothetical protein